MKKYFKVLFCSLLIGFFLAFLFYKDIKGEVRAVVKKEEIIDVFQVGVFENYDNAVKFSKAFRTSKIINDDKYYRVIIGASYTSEAKERLKDIFMEDGISYYIKSIRCNKNTINKFKEYEVIIVKSSKREVIDSVINSMLELI